MSVALLMPGQGAQTPGFLHALPDCPAVRDVLAEASELLSRDALELDTAEALESTVAIQISLLLAGVAFARFLEHGGVPIVAAAGMSLGTFSAAVAAGSLSLRDALELVRLRGQLMEQAFPGGTHGMAALEGLPRNTVERLLKGTGITLANDNAPLQFVLAGARAELDFVCVQALAQGAQRATLLRMNVPSHGEWLPPATTVLVRAAATVLISTPRFTLFANRDARPITSGEELREDLVLNMASLVMWRDIVAGLESSGIDLYLEAPPGHALAGLLRANASHVKILSAAEARWDVMVRAAHRVATLRGV